MKTTQSAVIYYGAVSILSLILIFMLVQWLSWPFLASAVLGGALFLHFLNLAKNGRDYYLNAQKKGITDELSERMRTAFDSPEPTNQES